MDRLDLHHQPSQRYPLAEHTSAEDLKDVTIDPQDQALTLKVF